VTAIVVDESRFLQDTCRNSHTRPPRAGQQLQGYSRQSAAMASKRFKASLDAPGFVFILTPTPEGKGNVLLQIDKDTAEPRARVDLGKEKEPVYAVDDIANMLFLQVNSDTVVGYRLSSTIVSTR
jgi:hypothetical protein